MSSATDKSKIALLSEKLRDDFPILTSGVHEDHPLIFLDNAASTQRPRQVIDAIGTVYQRDYANVHRGIHTLSERSTERYDLGRSTCRWHSGPVVIRRCAVCDRIRVDAYARPGNALHARPKAWR